VQFVFYFVLWWSTSPDIDNLNLVVSLTGGSTEVRDLGADGNNGTVLVILSPRDGSRQARVPTREALHKYTRRQIKSNKIKS